MRTICKLLDIEYPIVQGGMAWVADHHIAAAVSENGGLGIIAAGNAPGEWLREEIRACRAKTNKPFGVNIMLLSPYVEEIARIVIEEDVKVITTGAGNPGKYMASWQEAGMRVIPVVSSVALAKRMEKTGADAVIAEGCESGGHVGELTTMALVPQVVDAVSIPVVAAGGIGDGRGMAAAFMLGAQGIQVGTRFLVAKECHIPESYKERVIKASDIDTVVTGRSTGHPVRSLRNQLTRKFLLLEKQQASPEELDVLGVGALRKAAVEGDTMNGSVLAGQIAGMISKQQTTQEILQDYMEGFVRAIASLEKDTKELFVPKP